MHHNTCSAYLSKDELGIEAESPDINRHDDQEHNINSNYDCNNNEQNPILQWLHIWRKKCVLVCEYTIMCVYVCGFLASQY